MTQNTAKKPQVWGHRGAMDFAPQNTIPSFLLAAEQGADGVELDVQLTKDGVLVVFHDAVVDHLTDGRGPLADLPWTVVRKLDAGSHFGKSWAGTGIPTLEDVLAALPTHMIVNIEMKTSLLDDSWWDRWMTTVRGPRSLPAPRIAAARTEGQALAEALIKVLEYRGSDRFIISSFDPFALEALGHKAPRRTGLSPLPLGFLHSPTGRWDTPAIMASQTYQAWHPHHSEVTAEAVAREHRAGRTVNVWTVNDPRHAVLLAKVGVDAVITNRPGEILTALN